VDQQLNERQQKGKSASLRKGLIGAKGKNQKKKGDLIQEGASKKSYQRKRLRTNRFGKLTETEAILFPQ